ncbi:uncharacterized protein [Euwallacea similis]|uniref:uncharacterized protein n=1 Tax=Euwallacea similis TaxID=1736056 RepID=UPI00344CF7E0
MVSVGFSKQQINMSGHLKLFLCGVICLIALANLGAALECLLCESSDISSECRLGQRKFRPRVSHCNAPQAKCYALTQIDDKGTPAVRRGCTDSPDFCQKQTDVQYCQTCGSKLCNFWIMDLDVHERNSARNDKKRPSKEETNLGTEVRARRRVFDGADTIFNGNVTAGVKMVIGRPS